MREWLRRRHWRLAFQFGTLEHKFSRLVFVFLLSADGYYVWQIYPEHMVLGYILWVETLLWIIYWISHTVEKGQFHSAARRH